MAKSFNEGERNRSPGSWARGTLGPAIILHGFRKSRSVPCSSGVDSNSLKRVVATRACMLTVLDRELFRGNPLRWRGAAAQPSIRCEGGSERVGLVTATPGLQTGCVAHRRALLRVQGLAMSGCGTPGSHWGQRRAGTRSAQVQGSAECGAGGCTGWGRRRGAGEARTFILRPLF